MFRANRRTGQLTIFIIIGLLILIAVGITLFLYRSALVEQGVVTAEQAQLQTSVQSVSSFISDCISLVTGEGIKRVAAQGGVYRLPKLHLVIDGNQAAYHFYFGESRTPTLEQVEASIAEFVQDELPSCFRNFAFFEEQGVIVEVKSIMPKATIGDGVIIVSVNMPTEVSVGSAQTQLNEFVTRSTSSLYRLYLAGDRLVEEMVRENSIPLSVMVEEGLARNYTVQLVQEGTDVLFMLSDSLPVVNEFDEPLPPPTLTYAFGAKFGWRSE